MWIEVSYLEMIIVISGGIIIFLFIVRNYYVLVLFGCVIWVLY